MNTKAAYGSFVERQRKINLGRLERVEWASVVLDFDTESPRFQAETDSNRADFSRLISMSNDVGQVFFNRHV